MGELTGKVALITGGGRGQGRSHAIKLAAAGADIAICDIVEQESLVPYSTGRPGDLEETARLVEELDQRCMTKVVDVRDYEAVSGFTNAVVAELGTVDILVAQAGIIAPAPIQDTSPEQWGIVLDVNLTGIYNAIRAVAPIMIEKKAGRIIATASGLARVGAANMASYVASKWGVIGLIKSVAMDLGPYNITANALCLGLIKTPMNQNDVMRGLFNPEIENPTDDDLDRKIMSLGFHKMPIGMIDPVAVSNAVLFLASDQAQYVSGGTIDIGAGWASNHT